MIERVTDKWMQSVSDDGRKGRSKGEEGRKGRGCEGARRQRGCTSLVDLTWLGLCFPPQIDPPAAAVGGAGATAALYGAGQAGEAVRLERMRARVRRQFPVDEFNGVRARLDPHGILANELINRVLAN